MARNTLNVLKPPSKPNGLHVVRDAVNPTQCCDMRTSQVYNAGEETTKGWLCVSCLAFYPAVGREIKMPLTEEN